MENTNFDRYLEKQLQDPAFAARFERVGEAWDLALQVADNHTRQPSMRDVVVRDPILQCSLRVSVFSNR